jgi:protein ImuB
MKRFACLRLPRWPIQRLIVERPEWRGRPILVRRRDHRGEFIVECSTAARRAGVGINMPLSEATVLCPDAVLAVHDLAVDLIALAKLAEYCECFSPLVGWQTITPKVAAPWFGEAAAHLFLDLTSIAALFGGEAKLGERIIAGCRSCGYAAAVALADTLGAAWAVAKESLTIIPSGELETALRPLPVSQLRLPDEDVDTLARLGVLTIEQLMRLTRTGLAERLSPYVLLRLDQALGMAGEVIVPHRPAPKYQAAFRLEAPCDQRTTIDWLMEKLIERIAAELQAHGEGAVVVTGRFECEGSAEVKFEIGLFRPSASAPHIVKLLRLQTERLTLPAPVVRMCLHAVRTAPLDERQGELFADPGQNAAPERAALLERLSGRLGSAAVVRPVRQADAVPERAYRYVPIVGRRLRTKGKKTTTPPPSPMVAAAAVNERPLRLLTPPVRVGTASVKNGPPTSFQWQRKLHAIARHWGPERIETGWWRNTVRRDYYRVETNTGQRFWLFRDLRDGAWYLHGSFE